MSELSRYFDPENGDLCMTRKFLEPTSQSYAVTLAGYNVYVSMCIAGTWQHCKFTVAPTHIQEEACAFMRHADNYLPRDLPGLYVREVRRNNRWTITGVVEDGDILDHEQAATHKTIDRYNEALMAPVPPDPPNRTPAMNTVSV